MLHNRRLIIHTLCNITPEDRPYYTERHRFRLLEFGGRMAMSITVNQTIKIAADTAGELQTLETGKIKRHTQIGLHIHL